jgi:hypothetical protein
VWQQVVYEATGAAVSATGVTAAQAYIGCRGKEDSVIAITESAERELLRLLLLLL